MSKYEENLQKNAEISAEIVGRYLTGQEKGSDRIRIASQSISQFNRHLATKGNIDAIKFAVARSVADNPAELKKHIASSLPEYLPTKRLA